MITAGKAPYLYSWCENHLRIPQTFSGKENGRTHGVAVSRDGRIFVFHQATPSVLCFSPQGKLLDIWGVFPGAHGLTLVEEGAEEFLWLTDEFDPVVVKCTLEGRVRMAIGRPPHPAYASCDYRPTWIAVNTYRGGNGDIWIADGYGAHLLHRLDAKGNYLQTITGDEGGAGRFNCPHGIAFDPRKFTPELYIADRGNRRVQVYDSEGRFLRSFGENFLTSPDGFAFHGDTLIIPELCVRVTLCDARDRLVALLGENDDALKTPGWPEVDRAQILPGRFNSPHGAAADREGNIYIVEWLVGGRITLLRRLTSASHMQTQPTTTPWHQS